MEVWIVNAKIALVLLGWIVAVCGFGFLALVCLKKIAHIGKIDNTLIIDTKFYILFVGLLGVFFLSLIVQFLHFIIPISSSVSFAFMGLGVGLFAYLLPRGKRAQTMVEDTLQKRSTLFIAIILAFILCAVFAMRPESAYDTGLYHIQAVKWVQQEALHFGIANIHTRFGFNNILYNFAALTEVSHFFPQIRSFLSVEIICFFFFVSGVLGLVHLQHKNLDDIFMGIALSLALIFSYWLGGGMYAEGVLGILGLSVCGYCLKLLNLKAPLQNLRFSFFILYMIGFFCVFVKISAIFVLIGVVLVHWQCFRISKQCLRDFLLFMLFGAFLGSLWALKGIITSGMIAYPASVGYFPKLPWAIDDTTRAREVTIIANWARVAGTPNGQELLNNGTWMGLWWDKYVWVGTFKLFLQFCLAGIVGIVLLRVIGWLKFADLSKYAVLGLSLIGGIVFWFLSAPDPRFGYQYFFPLGAFLVAFCVLVLLERKQYHLVIIILCICSIHINKHLATSGIDTADKIPHIELKSATKDSGMVVFLPTKGDRVYDAPLPATPYFNPKLSKKSFLGRDMYYKETK